MHFKIRAKTIVIILTMIASASALQHLVDEFRLLQTWGSVTGMFCYWIAVPLLVTCISTMSSSKRRINSCMGTSIVYAILYVQQAAAGSTAGTLGMGAFHLYATPTLGLFLSLNVLVLTAVFRALRSSRAIENSVLGYRLSFGRFLRPLNFTRRRRR